MVDIAHKKVFVALSGGVDSSVSAGLLKGDGYEVTGVFMNVWQPDFLECSRGDDRREAMRAAAHLGIPFLVFDFEDAYKEHVVDYMVSEYKKGRTPNPDVMCNKYIKFGLFYNKAREMGADYIATGHYARTTKEGALLRGVDSEKDQSYFLWAVKSDQLSHTLFPVGGYTKKEVRIMARMYALPNASRKESQGVCFIGEFDMKKFLSHYIPKREGSVLNEEGEAIGWHEGAFFLTLGQRHGFTITQKTPNETPYYIVKKDIENNTITVLHKKDQKAYAQKKVALEGVSFISGMTPLLSQGYRARVRYRQPLQDCFLEEGIDGSYTVIFNEPQITISEGQSVVFYDGETCLGGGIIT